MAIKMLDKSLEEEQESKILKANYDLLD